MKKKAGISSSTPSRSKSSLTYWAAESSENIAAEILEKVREYYLFLYQSGRLDLYEKVYTMYYGPALQGAQVNFTGQTGELISITINDLRNLTKRLITLVTQDRLAFECRATNTDYKSDAQTILGKGLLDYYLREKKLEVYHANATEIAMMYGEGYLSVEWNASLGDPYTSDPETGEVVTNGDIEYKIYSPMTLVKDPVQINPFMGMWKTKIDWVNKYELAAKFPEYADRIVNLLPTYDLFVDYSSNLLWQSRQALYGNFISDEIPMFIFYHEKCKVLPEGRMVWCLADNTTLIDSPLPYTEVPIYRISAGEWQGTPFGYTTTFDLMPICEMTDSLDSTICTNQNAFGVQNIYCQRGNGLEVSTITGGMNLLEGNSEQPPVPLQLTATAKEIFDYRQMLKEDKNNISGMNAVAQGNPNHEMSGQMAALMTSMAVQFSMDLQSSYVRLFEDSGTATLDRLKTFATVPRVAAIAGKTRQQYMKEFIGADIENINRVMVTQGNPMLNTAAGKQWLAEFMTQQGVIKTPEEIIMVMTTGNAEPLYEGQQSELTNIKRENEMLQEGQLPQVLITDNVLLHLKEHASVANSPEARSNPQVMQVYTMHIQSHLANWKGGLDPTTGLFCPPMDMDLANLLGIPVPPQPILGQPIAGGDQVGQPQGAPSGEPPPEPGSGNTDIKLPKTPEPPPGTPSQFQSTAPAGPQLQ